MNIDIQYLTIFLVKNIDTLYTEIHIKVYLVQTIQYDDFIRVNSFVQ